MFTSCDRSYNVVILRIDSFSFQEVHIDRLTPWILR